MTQPTHHPLGRSDFPDVYRFLQRYTRETGRIFWEQRRLDGLFFHDETAQNAVLTPSTAARCALWRDADGGIVAAVFSEDDGSYSPHVLPRHKNLVPEVLAWIAARTPERIVCHDEDAIWVTALVAAGFRPGPIDLLSLSCHLPTWRPKPTALLPGYRVRTLLQSDSDAAQMAALLNAAFRRDFHTAAEYRAFQRSAPAYAQTLDLVVVDRSDRVVATAGFVLLGSGTDGLAVLEPVATHPLVQRTGCAAVLLQHGCTVAQRRGMRTLVVGVGAHNRAARRLYEGIGCAVQAHERVWYPGAHGQAARPEA